MKTNLYLVALLTGFAGMAMAQSPSPAGGAGSAPVQGAPSMPAGGNNGQNLPPQNPNQMSPAQPGNFTNAPMNPMPTNRPGGYNNGMTNIPSAGLINGNGAGGMSGTMPTNKFNPYAGYTNPNSTYINPNSTNVNRYANYTNPYAIDTVTNLSGTPAGVGGNNGMTNGSSMTNRYR